MHNFSFSHFFSQSQDNLVCFSAPRPISYKNIKEYNSISGLYWHTKNKHFGKKSREIRKVQ